MLMGLARSTVTVCADAAAAMRSRQAEMDVRFDMVRRPFGDKCFSCAEEVFLSGCGVVKVKS